MSSRCALIIFSLLFIHTLHTYGSNETTTTVLAYYTTINAKVTTESTHYSSNSTSVYNTTETIRVLIINNSTDSGLRHKNYGPQRAKSLLYEERDNKRNTLSSYVMNTLDDVANFFKSQLETQICYVRCPGDLD